MDEVLEDDWVGIFTGDPRSFLPTKIYTPPPTTTTASTTTTQQILEESSKQSQESPFRGRGIPETDDSETSSRRAKTLLYPLTNLPNNELDNILKIVNQNIARNETGISNVTNDDSAITITTTSTENIDNITPIVNENTTPLLIQKPTRYPFSSAETTTPYSNTKMTVTSVSEIPIFNRIYQKPNIRRSHVGKIINGKPHFGGKRRRRKKILVRKRDGVVIERVVIDSPKRNTVQTESSTLITSTLSTKRRRPTDSVEVTQGKPILVHANKTSEILITESQDNLKTTSFAPFTETDNLETFKREEIGFSHVNKDFASGSWSPDEPDILSAPVEEIVSYFENPEDYLFNKENGQHSHNSGGKLDSSVTSTSQIPFRKKEEKKYRSPVEKKFESKISTTISSFESGENYSNEETKHSLGTEFFKNNDNSKSYDIHSEEDQINKWQGLKKTTVVDYDETTTQRHTPTTFQSLQTTSFPSSGESTSEFLPETTSHQWQDASQNFNSDDSLYPVSKKNMKENFAPESTATTTEIGFQTYIDTENLNSSFTTASHLPKLETLNSTSAYFSTTEGDKPILRGKTVSEVFEIFTTLPPYRASITSKPYPVSINSTNKSNKSNDDKIPGSNPSFLGKEHSGFSSTKNPEEKIGKKNKKTFTVEEEKSSKKRRKYQEQTTTDSSTLLLEEETIMDQSSFILKDKTTKQPNLKADRIPASESISTEKNLGTETTDSHMTYVKDYENYRNVLDKKEVQSTSETSSFIEDHTSLPSTPSTSMGSHKRSPSLITVKVDPDFQFTTEEDVTDTTTLPIVSFSSLPSTSTTDSSTTKSTSTVHTTTTAKKRKRKRKIKLRKRRKRVRIRNDQNRKVPENQESENSGNNRRKKKNYMKENVRRNLRDRGDNRNRDRKFEHLQHDQNNKRKRRNLYSPNIEIHRQQFEDGSYNVPISNSKISFGSSFTTTEKSQQKLLEPPSIINQPSSYLKEISSYGNVEQLSFSSSMISGNSFEKQNDAPEIGSIDFDYDSDHDFSLDNSDFFVADSESYDNRISKYEQSIPRTKRGLKHQSKQTVHRNENIEDDYVIDFDYSNLWSDKEETSKTKQIKQKASSVNSSDVFTDPSRRISRTKISKSSKHLEAEIELDKKHRDHKPVLSNFDYQVEDVKTILGSSEGETFMNKYKTEDKKTSSKNMDSKRVTDLFGLIIGKSSDTEVEGKKDFLQKSNPYFIINQMRLKEQIKEREARVQVFDSSTSNTKGPSSFGVQPPLDNLPEFVATNETNDQAVPGWSKYHPWVLFSALPTSTQGRITSSVKQPRISVSGSKNINCHSCQRFF